MFGIQMLEMFDDSDKSVGDDNVKGSTTYSS